MHIVAHDAWWMLSICGGNLFDRDLVIIVARLTGQGIVTRRKVLLALGLFKNANVLTRLERTSALAITGNHAKRFDVGRFLDNVSNDKVTGSRPLFQGRLVVQLGFLFDKELGQGHDGFTPRRSDSRSHGVSQDFSNGFKKIVMDNLIILGLNAQGTMLVTDSNYSFRQVFQVLNIKGI